MNALEKLAQGKANQLDTDNPENDIVYDLLIETAEEWLDLVFNALKHHAHPIYGIHDFADSKTLIQRLEENNHL